MQLNRRTLTFLLQKPQHAETGRSDGDGADGGGDGAARDGGISGAGREDARQRWGYCMCVCVCVCVCVRLCVLSVCEENATQKTFIRGSDGAAPSRADSVTAVNRANGASEDCAIGSAD